MLAAELLGRLVNGKLDFCFLFIVQVSHDSGSSKFFGGVYEGTGDIAKGKRDEGASGT